MAQDIQALIKVINSIVKQSDLKGVEPIDSTLLSDQQLLDAVAQLKEKISVKHNQVTQELQNELDLRVQNRDALKAELSEKKDFIEQISKDNRSANREANKLESLNEKALERIENLLEKIESGVNINTQEDTQDAAQALSRYRIARFTEMVETLKDEIAERLETIQETRAILVQREETLKNAQIDWEQTKQTLVQSRELAREARLELRKEIRLQDRLNRKLERLEDKNEDSNDDGVLNTEPVALDDTATVLEDGSVVIDLLANDSDEDGDTLSVASIGSASNGSVVDNGDGTITYTPDANFNGFDSVEYVVSDGRDHNKTAKVVIAVQPVNDAPVANSDTIAFDVHEFTPTNTVVGKIEAQDFDNDTIQYEIISGNDEDAFYIDKVGFVSVSRWASGVDYETKSTYNLVVKISDQSAENFVNLNINIVDGDEQTTNEAPVPNVDRYSFDEDSGTQILHPLLNDTDPEGGPLRITQINNGFVASKGTAILNDDNSVEYTPFENADGRDQISYAVIDEQGMSKTSFIIIDIVSMEDSPEIEDMNLYTFGTNSIEINLLENAFDPDGDDIFVHSIGDVVHGSLSINDAGILTYIPNDTFVGSDTFSYSVSDTNGNISSASITVNSSHTIEARDDLIEVIAGRTTVLDVTDNDFFNPELHNIRITSMPSQGNITVNPDGTLALVLTDPAFTGHLSFTYAVDDGEGNVSDAHVNLDVLKSPQEDGWGYGDLYILQTDANNKTIVEAGENHRKVFVTGGDHGLTKADIAVMEGLDESQITDSWLSQNPEYGGSEDLALAIDVGMELWYKVTTYKTTSNWLLFEKGYEYADAGRIISRGANGESELNPIHVTSWGEGEKPIINGITGYQADSHNFVFSDLHMGERIMILDGADEGKSSHFIFESISTRSDYNIQNVDYFSLRNSSIIDVYKEIEDAIANGDAWDPYANRYSGALISGTNGLLIENTLIDHNGWADGYDYNASLDSPHPPSYYSHNLYIQDNTRDVTYRNNINSRGASFGAQFRGGAFIEDNVFLDNNIAFSSVGGNYKEAGPVGNYTLVLDNIVTSAGYKTVALFEGGINWGVDDGAILTSYHQNIVAHMADPNNTDEIAEKSRKAEGQALKGSNFAYDDTIVYNWESINDTEDVNNRNVEGLDQAVLDQITIQNYAAALLGNPNATIADLLDYIRLGGGSAIDGLTDAELIVRYFQVGFGITPYGVSSGGEIIRFIPDEVGEGVRWDNKLNWETGYKPNDGDSVQLAGNWVRFSGTVTLQDLDFGGNGNISGGSLTVRNGYLQIDGDVGVAEVGASLEIGMAGQFWSNGYADDDVLTIVANGGRFGNIGDWNGAYMIAVSGNAQVIFATGGATFTVDDDDSISISGSDAKVGFDGEAGGDAKLVLGENGTLSYDIDSASTVMVREFKSGHFGDAPDINSVVDLGHGNANLDVDLTDVDLVDGVYSYDLVGDIDVLIGDVGNINIIGRGADISALSFSFNRASDTVTMDLNVNDSGHQDIEVNIYGSDEVDTFFINGNEGIIENIHNFDASEDVLNIGDLLQGYDPLSSNLSDFVSIVEQNGDSVLRIDADGAGNSVSFVALTILKGVTGLSDIQALEDSNQLVTVV